MKMLLKIMGIIVMMFVLLMVIGYWTGKIVVESSGYYSDFVQLDKSLQKRVMAASDLDSLKADDNVYTLQPKQLKQYLSSRGKVLIYSYIPYCTRNNCISPLEAYQKCKNAEVELMLIAEGYHKLFENTAKYPQPVFMIDSQFFGTDIREEYVYRFYSCLVGFGKWHRFNGGLYFCFNHGCFIKQCEKIDDALKFLKETDK